VVMSGARGHRLSSSGWDTSLTLGL
jgi:hypothetical protein